MLPTVEIRWFIKGEIPDLLLDWFNGLKGDPTIMSQRTDYYLCMPDTGIGIKIREGLIEHKQRSDGMGELWSDGVHSGAIEQWEKWSFPLDDTGAMHKMLDTYPESWQGITKKRSIRILDFDEKNRIRNTSYEALKETACGWELTELIIEGSPDKWWTMGFEAFGDIQKLKQTLLKVCDHVLKESPTGFNASNSFAYPEWIKSI